MKKLIILLCGILSLTSIGVEATAAKSSNRFQNSQIISTWLWDTSRIVAERDKIIKNLESRHVNLLLLQIDPDLDHNFYKAFISRANKKGISVHALDGAPEWAAENGEVLQESYLDWLKQYQQAALPDEQFTGIHLDVEPYGHEQYEDNINEFIGRYQAMMVDFQAQAESLGLEFGIDIPFWFYGVEYDNEFGQGNVAEWLCQHVKSITIMAYRDKAEGDNGIISISAKEMSMFEQYNVQGTIAVETGRLTDEYKFVTFYEEKQSYMYKQLDIVYDHYKNSPAFNGIAIHYYDSWIKMK